MLEKKIKTLSSLMKITADLKSKGKKIVFTNGCFDLLHYGHVKYLEDAKRKGDILIVAINSDQSVRSIKGNKRPLVNQKDRARIIAGLESVDYVVIFDQDTPLETIKALRPDILIKGSDWKKNHIVGGDFVLRHGGKVMTIGFIKGCSTTDIINKIVQGFRNKRYR